MLSLISTGCDDNPVSNEDENQIELMMVSSKQSSQDQFTVMTTDSLAVGYNEIYIEVKDSEGDLRNLSNPVIKPIMYMPTKTHSAPASGTEIVEANGSTYLKADIYFVMPSMDGSQWVLRVSGERADGSSLETEIDVDVANSSLQRKMTVNDRMYILTYVQPKTPVVGGDVYEVAVHYKQDMMNFPALESAQVEIDPFMDMGGGEGHGPTSVQAVADEQGNGRYKGDIVYNMSGEWQLTFSVTAGDSVDITFPEIEIMVE
jgi:hypothetical protein